MSENVKIAKIFNNSKWVIYLMALLIGSAIGIIILLTSTHMSRNHVNELLIGVIESVYFLTLAIGTVFINKKMRNRDLKKLIILGLIISSICTIVFPLIFGGTGWFVLMAIMGFGVSFHLVGTQTALHSFSDDSNRGVISGVYTLFFAFGFAAGTIGGPRIYEFSVYLSFIVAAACLLLAALILSLKIKVKLYISARPKEDVAKKIALSLQGAFSYGFIENTIVAIYPVFLLKHNFTLSQIGYALGMFVIGGIVGTIPITYIGDRIGREKSLIISVFISIAAFIGIIQFHGLIYRFIFSFMAGIGIGAIYPVSMALGVQGLNKEEIISAASNFTFFYSFGCAAGPALSSVVMNKLGNNYLFSICLILLLTLLPHLFLKVTRAQVQDA
ncbi:MFS transporter [Clostridium pasteurianum]|uniref:Sugar phosphate permease n=1 Tax=Clostridium pasteurianum BC1 TaxID=86416 RepID=R4K9H1_CLOPA|nr:MFS transporter [Clostridium pasteurianum]AGK96290.1 sugar phosphate permease [Clostridium pasteurianum BC1]